MKRLFFVLTFLLAGCAHDSRTAPVSPLPLANFFEFNGACPQTCFMGIMPGITKRENVSTLLSTSDQFSVPVFRKEENDFIVQWYLIPSTQVSTWVNISINPQDDLVQSIIFKSIDPYRINDFAGLLGEPDEISAFVEEPADARYISYSLYYSKINVLLYIQTDRFTGHQKDDVVDQLYINAPMDEEHVPPWIVTHYNNRQPWLGYGHLEEYIPGIETSQNP